MSTEKITNESSDVSLHFECATPQYETKDRKLSIESEQRNSRLVFLTEIHQSQHKRVFSRKLGKRSESLQSLKAL